MLALRVFGGGVFAFGLVLSACSQGPEEATSEEFVATESVAQALTAAQRLAACAQDPRVVAGLVTQQICAGADIFFRETFNGNGRTCGSCHPVANNMTVDRTFIN